MTTRDSMIRVVRPCGSVVFGVLLYIVCAQTAHGAAFEIDSVEFVPPSEISSRYHLAIGVENNAGDAVTVTSVAVNGEAQDSFAVFVGEKLSENDSIPAGERARVRVSYSWEGGARYSADVKAESVESKYTATAKTTPAPRGGYWNGAWKGYKVLNVVEEAGLNRENEPVELRLNFPADQMRDPHKELRLVAIESGSCREVPFQILETSSVGVEGEEYPDTVACRLLFYASVPANSNRDYIVFYDNPDASVPAPASSKLLVKLKVAGEGLGLTIDNPYYTVTLAKQSGQINGIFIKQGVEQQLSHGGNAIHWNPGCFSPPRPWGHTFDWNPPEGKSEVRGPLVYVLKRWGCLPKLPEVWVSVTYTFYAHTPYILMSSTIDIRDDIDVLALRNDEMVFEPQLFSDLGWRDRQGTFHTVALGQDPALETGYTKVMPADTPWLCFFTPDGGYGFGSLRLAYGSASTTGAEAVTYNEGTFVTAPNDALVYWYRALVYHFFPTAPVQMFTKVNAGSVYHETNAYLPFPLAETADDPLEPINEMYEKLMQPLRITTVDWGRDDLLAVGQKAKD